MTGRTMPERPLAGRRAAAGLVGAVLLGGLAAGAGRAVPPPGSTTPPAADPPVDVRRNLERPPLERPSIERLDDDRRAALGLRPGTHAQALMVGAVPIVASERVRPVALREAAYLVDRMTAGRPELLDVIGAAGVRLVVMAPTEVTTDVPEHADLDPAAYWDRRARGLGATRARPAVSCGEENLLAIAGDPYAGESILVHEFAHVVHEFGMAALDPTFDDRLRVAFEASMAADRWAGTYAATNRHEWFAEAVQSYFDTNREGDREHGPVNTRDELAAYDPALLALVEEALGSVDWRYVPVAGRLAEGHLAGWDPASAAPFRWSERTLVAWREHQRRVEGTPIGLQPIRPGAPPPPNSADGGASTTVRFVNRSRRSYRIAWIDTLGQPRDFGWLRGGGERTQSTFAGHTWLVLDADGVPVGWFRATEAAGRILLDAAVPEGTS